VNASSDVKVLGTVDVPTGSLREHPMNPNRGDVGSIARSLDEFGQYRAIIVRTDGTILAGHHVWAAALKRKRATIRVEQIECDDDTALRIVLADNRLAELGPGIDPQKLFEALSEVDNLQGTGYSGEDLAALELAMNPPAPKGDPDHAPPVSTEPLDALGVRAGQVWRCGPHVLAVGDCTSTAVLDRLLEALGVDQVDGLITDPPYGVSYEGSPNRPASSAVGISNDELRGDALTNLIESALANANRWMPKACPWYIFGPSAEQQFMFRQAIFNVGWQVRSECVWVKNIHVLGHSDYQMKHESCLTGGDDPDTEGWVDQPPEGHEVALYGWKNGAAHRWLGDRKQTTVWEYPKPRSSADHPTMKPVDLIAAILSNSVPPGGVVLDLFSGSGTIMAAAFLTGRRAAMVELDPRYADVILRRWENLTGEPAEQVVVGDGES
jgi:site-specific DNA-methyltransferase (adenine-specific)